jgi:hypothetical protein
MVEEEEEKEEKEEEEVVVMRNWLFVSNAAAPGLATVL